MQPIHVVIAATLPDLQAEGIRAAVEAEPRGSMVLVGGGVVPLERVGSLLAGLPPATPCAVILVQDSGGDAHTAEIAAGWRHDSDNLLLLRVTVGGDTLEIAARNVSMRALIAAVKGLLDPDGSAAIEYVSVGPDVPRLEDARTRLLSASSHLLFHAAIDWTHAILRAAVQRLIDSAEDGTAAIRLPAVADWIDRRAPRTPLLDDDAELVQAEAALDAALQAADDAEPLACLVRTFGLDAVEARLLFLALGPEFDARYQRWIALLLDDPVRRVGTLGLFAELLGNGAGITRHVLSNGHLARWRLFEGAGGALPPADEPLRVDAPLRRWLFGAERALQEDPALGGLLVGAWAGAELIDDPTDCGRAGRLLGKLRPGASWLLLSGDGAAIWRALIEAGAAQDGRTPLRVDLAQVAHPEAADAEEAGFRLARLARLSDRTLVFDGGELSDDRANDARLRRLFAAVGKGCDCAAVITPDPARIAALLGPTRYEIEHAAQSGDARISILQNAAAAAGAEFTREAAESLANLFPLQIDGFVQAVRIAQARPGEGEDEESRRARFITACKDVSADGASGLAQRIEPRFRLSELVLPADRKGQLDEIVDHVRFAPRVLDGWRFRDQLPYGLGVTALFHGPSGTGKTMAAMAVAHSLGVQVLRIDLSRLVSKYIGDTEKNIDRIFLEAQHSGAALLIDEADGLLSRRGEVKDAHDRYANLEVAYLLQRMEAHEGLAILTTNLRQNLDPAFLRRLRFIVDFPRPDAAAREAIWRYCLPDEAHSLDDAAFRQLARKIELTGGSIRQITLRAAFIAAAAGTRIGLAQIAQASRAEYAKLGVPPVEIDWREERRAA